MSNVLGLENFRQSAELNSVQPEHTYTEKSPVVEIFSAMTKGEDTSKYGEKANKAYNYIKTLGANAQAGDGKSKVELNTITSIQIQAPLLQRLQLFNFMGNVTNVAYDERLLYKVYKLQGKMSGLQASNGDVPFATSTWDYREMTTQPVSGGMAVNYRELAAGNFSNQGVLAEQVVTDMTNKVFSKVISDLYTGVKASTGVKNFAEAAGITKASVQAAIKKARRFGSVGIFGDYNVTSQLNEMTGFNTDTAGTLAKQLPISVIEEIMKTGLISTFYNTPVTEIPNAYNLTKLNAAGTDYDLYLPDGLLFFLVSGAMAPLQVGMRGGLTSKSGFDVVTGLEITRFDLEFGDVLIPEYTPMIGLISDTTFAQTKSF